MAAILGLDDAPVAAACAEAAQGEVVEPVNFNAPGQIVIAGHRERGRARDRGARRRRGAKRALLLPVSAPFHSSLMQAGGRAARERISATVDVARRAIPVIHNVDVSRAADAGAIREALGAPGGQPGALGRNDPGVRRAMA